MKDLYPDAAQLLPHNIPESRGEEVDINLFVDADHAGNRVTCRSHTDIIIMLNMAPVMWFSKKQNTIETSTFGSEITALRIATELVESLVYKFRMFGVPIAGPTKVFCDKSIIYLSKDYKNKNIKPKYVKPNNIDIPPVAQ